MGGVLSWGQAFGRFGYTQSWSVPGLILTKEGVRSEHPAADWLRFASPLRQWKAMQTSDVSQTVSVGEFSGNPSKLRQDLTAPGFSAYFPKGIRLSLRCNSGPILTWGEGQSMEANTGYETPAAPWVLVSFRDAQPPILFAFTGKSGSLRLTGKTGDWVLANPTYEGWVRICAPLGIKPFATNSAADLGKLTKVASAGVALGTGPAPVLTNLSVTDEGPGVLAEWTYDRPGALLPFAVFLSPMGGYGVQVASKTRRIDADTMSGPTIVADEAKIRLRFMVRRVPSGRAVLLGKPTLEPIATASALDYASVTELALSNLISSQDKGPRDLAGATVAEFLTTTNYSAEPNTGQRLPYDGPGNGLDLAAAHAFLLQSTLTTSKPTSEPNALLTSLVWRRDWLTWQLACEDITKRRRAMALTALAAAISPESERRLDAAMLQAGLAAERGLAIWRQRTQKGAPPTPLPETFESLREDIFGKDDYRRKGGFGKALLSELRSFGDVAVAVELAAKGPRLLWKAEDSNPMTITLAAAYPIEVQAGKNVVSLQATQGLGFTILRVVPAGAGPCEAALKLPEWATALPVWTAPPRFDEVMK